MALNNDLCNEIFNKENQWIKEINDGLINAIYCEYVLKAFYLVERKKLKDDYSLSKDEKSTEVIEAINKILNQIDEFGAKYRNGQTINIDTIIPFFLVNQLNNQKTDSQELTEIDKLNIKSQVLKYLSQESSKKTLDYVYDDFPEDNKII